jgi:hypothetical protein
MNKSCMPLRIAVQQNDKVFQVILPTRQMIATDIKQTHMT